jgi:peptide/nickel transport system substrate-binding protein
MKRLRILILFTVLALLAVGMTHAQDEKVLVIGHAEATDSYDPAHGYTQTTGIVEKAAYDTLLTYPADNASEVLPSLATSWEVSDDGLTYTFTLRDDAVFADGDPVTAEDVAFSLLRLKNVHGNPSFLAADIATVEASDDHTAVVTLSAPNAGFLHLLPNGAFSIVDSEAVIANGGSSADDAETADTAMAYLDSTSAGSGPYVLESWTPQEQTVLVRNENYWGEAPYYDRIIIQNIPEAATQKAALEGGDVDMALDLTRDQATTMEGNDAITITSAPSNYTHFVLMNENAEMCGPLSDPVVQNAIRYAIDYEGYITLWGGITPAAPTAVAAFFVDYGTDHAIQRDVDHAKELLAEAGYPDGLDVTLDYPVFTFQGVNMETNAQKLAADLEEAGIHVTLNGGDLQTKLQEYRDGAECFGLWFWGPDRLDPLDTLAFLPGGNVAGRAQWTDPDPEIVALRDAAVAETDPEASVEAWHAVYAWLQEKGPWAALIQPDVYTAFDSDIQGYVWHPQWLVDLAKLSVAE